MDIEVLKYFKTIARIGNMSRAAKELHVSQPTLTVAIKKLEDLLGVLLFERSKKGVTLTEAGLQIYQYSDQMTELWDEMLREAGSRDQTVKGTVRLGVHPSVARYTLPLFLPALLKEHPKMTVQLSIELSRHVLQMIRDGSIEVGLVMNPEPVPDLVIKEVCTDEVTIWKKKNTSNQETLIYDPNLFQTQTILQRLEKRDLRYERRIPCTNLEVIESLLMAGAGHAILPRRVIPANAKDIEEAHPQIPGFKDSLRLVYRSNFKKTATGKTFIDAVLKAQF